MVIAFKKLRRRLAAGAVLAAIAMAAVTDLKTEQAKVMTELIKVEQVVKLEQAQAKKSHLTWADVRRMIAADVKLQKELKGKEAELTTDEAYFEAMRQKFLALAKKEKGLSFVAKDLFFTKDLVRSIKKELDINLKTDRQRVILERESNLGELDELQKYALLTDEQRQLLSKVNKDVDYDQITEKEGQELAKLEAFYYKQEFQGSFEEVQEQFIAQLRMEKEVYSRWVSENDSSQKFMGKLLGFIFHNQLEQVLGQELQALQELDRALEKQTLEMEVFINEIDDLIDQTSALQPSR
ncbi:hypothetical protein J4479_00955 [Candidatus Woesearchaeota archaeon]|nr:hypothetical protein [Candidatus Woesearchaeota archaeon]